MLPDLTIVAALRRFLVTPDEILESYKKAFDAYSKRSTEVTITSKTLEGGGVSGQISGDPKALMVACEYLLKEKEGGVQPNNYGSATVEFCRRMST